MKISANLSALNMGRDPKNNSGKKCDITVYVDTDENLDPESIAITAPPEFIFLQTDKGSLFKIKRSDLASVLNILPGGSPSITSLLSTPPGMRMLNARDIPFQK